MKPASSADIPTFSNSAVTKACSGSGITRMNSVGGVFNGSFSSPASTTNSLLDEWPLGLHALVDALERRRAILIPHIQREPPDRALFLAGHLMHVHARQRRE